MRETHTQRMVRLHAEKRKQDALSHPAVVRALAEARDEERQACAAIADRCTRYVSSFASRFIRDAILGQHELAVINEFAASVREETARG